MANLKRPVALAVLHVKSPLALVILHVKTPVALAFLNQYWRCGDGWLRGGGHVVGGARDVVTGGRDMVGGWCICDGGRCMDGERWSRCGGAWSRCSGGDGYASWSSNKEFPAQKVDNKRREGGVYHGEGARVGVDSSRGRWWGCGSLRRGGGWGMWGWVEGSEGERLRAYNGEWERSALEIETRRGWIKKGKETMWLVNLGMIWFVSE
ncbi:hypothetical protein LguiB_000609 [Lonicera macranthoides]